MAPVEKKHRQRGAVIIEATLTLMLFLFLVFSLFDFGYVLFFHHTLMQRARAAARFGIVLDANTAENRTKIRNVFLYNDAENRTGATTGLLGLTANNVNVTFAPKTATDPVERLVLSIHGYQYTLITFDFAGYHRGQDIIVSLPMEYR